MGLESLLGFTHRGDLFSLDPCIPSIWKAFSLTWRHAGTRYEISVENPAGCCRGVVEAWLDGIPVDPAAIPVVQDGRTHQVRAILGKKVPELQASLPVSGQIASGEVFPKAS